MENLFTLQKLAYSRQRIAAMMLHNALCRENAEVSYGARDIASVRAELEPFLANGFFESLERDSTLPLLGFNFSLHDENFAMYPRDILYLLPDSYNLAHASGETLIRGDIESGWGFSFAGTGLGPVPFGFRVEELHLNHNHEPKER